MKTPREHWNDLILARSLAVETIEARDAEWRRLVEEAQAREAACKITIATLGADLEAQLEEVAEGDRIIADQGDKLCETEGERDRLKRELAEARSAFAEIGRCKHGCDLCDDHMSVPQLIAATPAEQVQPSTEAEKRCVRPDCGRLESCHDVPFAVANHDFEAAEQAQAQGVPHVTCETVPKGEWCFGCGEALTPSNRHTGPACIIETSIAELAKRVDALTNLVTSLARDSATQGAMVEVQNKVSALEAERPGKGWVGHYCDQPTACPHRMTPPAPPPPEAAGPGHVYSCLVKDCQGAQGTLGLYCPCHQVHDGLRMVPNALCGCKRCAEAAVPPIPEVHK